MGVDVLLFGAHPDDVEWAIGGIALMLRDAGMTTGMTTGIVDMTEGEMGSRGTVALRRNEARLAAEAMGARFRENLRLPDCGLVDSPENRRLVASAIRRHCPKIVLAPLWEDRHPDHAAAGLIVQKSRLLCGLSTLEDSNPPCRPAILFYPIHQFHPPTFVVDTSALYERKVELMRMYASQFGEATTEDFLFRLESRDRYVGSLIGSRHGEALVADRPIALAHGLGDLFSVLGLH